MTLADAPTSPPREVEAFGQNGIRRFVLPLFVTASLLAAVASVTMWARSYNTYDALSFSLPGEMWTARSIVGRLLVAHYGMSRDARTDGQGVHWDYATGPVDWQVQDRWRESWLKRIGFEIGTEPLFGPPGLVSGGGWMRVRWPLAATVFSIAPIAQFISRLTGQSRRRKRKRDLHDEEFSRA